MSPIQMRPFKCPLAIPFLPRPAHPSSCSHAYETVSIPLCSTDRLPFIRPSIRLSFVPHTRSFTNAIGLFANCKLASFFISKRTRRRRRRTTKSVRIAESRTDHLNSPAPSSRSLLKSLSLSLSVYLLDTLSHYLVWRFSLSQPEKAYLFVRKCLLFLPIRSLLTVVGRHFEKHKHTIKPYQFPINSLVQRSIKQRRVDCIRDSFDILRPLRALFVRHLR
jgi:hypothetical protein